MHTKWIAYLLHTKNFGLEGILETLKRASACFLLVCETNNERFHKSGFWKLFVPSKRKRATTVSNLYKRNVVEMLKNEIELCASAYHLQLRTHPKKRFKQSMKMACFSLLKSRTRHRILCNSFQHVFWNQFCFQIILSSVCSDLYQ